MRRLFCDNATVATVATVATPAAVGGKQNSVTKGTRFGRNLALKNLHDEENAVDDSLFVRPESVNGSCRRGGSTVFEGTNLACSPSPRLTPASLPPSPPPPPPPHDVALNLLSLCHACASPKPAKVAPISGDGFRGAFSTDLRGAFSTDIRGAFSTDLRGAARISDATFELCDAFTAVPQSPNRGCYLRDRLNAKNTNRDNSNHNNSSSSKNRGKKQSSRLRRSNYGYQNQIKDSVFDKTLPLLLSQNSGGGHDGSAGGGNNSYSVTIHTANNNNRSRLQSSGPCHFFLYKSDITFFALFDSKIYCGKWINDNSHLILKSLSMHY